MDIFTSLTAEEIAHSKRTAEISRILAEHADYDSAEVHEVYQAALLHDIGKTMIPVRIRCKSGSLSEVERSSMRKHTSIGHFLLLQTGTMLGLSLIHISEPTRQAERSYAAFFLQKKLNPMQ